LKKLLADICIYFRSYLNSAKKTDGGLSKKETQSSESAVKGELLKRRAENNALR
jgi:hypothetical protein